MHTHYTYTEMQSLKKKFGYETIPIMKRNFLDKYEQKNSISNNIIS